jgi:hypothetical protein
MDESKDEFGLWTCPGPAGYAVRFADTDKANEAALARAEQAADSRCPEE